ncbi:putative hydro-lyase [Vandammella animalimorsus]|uniref:putative hydro-lyase n=1 Tax=Vandammella animalimorsus TaxID=2029117 RepID=UPI00325C10A8
MTATTIAAASADLHTAIGVRHAARSGRLTAPTAGLAPGHVQVNLVILPQALAADFLRFCQRNPKACPLLAVSEPGDWRLPELGADLDLRSDVPRYRVWSRGELVAEPTQLGPYWRDDLVSFALGCSFSFEEALLNEGIEVRHVALNCNVPMYRTQIATTPAGTFGGPLVVSMRPFKAADAIRAIQITSRFPSVHGAPVHLGDPEQIGISDLAHPDYGDPVPVHAGEVPVFWACGVTPQSVIAATRPDFCITHAPGHMLVSDLYNHQMAVL